MWVWRQLLPLIIMVNNPRDSENRHLSSWWGTEGRIWVERLGPWRGQPPWRQWQGHRSHCEQRLRCWMTKQKCLCSIGFPWLEEQVWTISRSRVPSLSGCSAAVCPRGCMAQCNGFVILMEGFQHLSLQNTQANGCAGFPPSPLPQHLLVPRLLLHLREGQQWS